MCKFQSTTIESRFHKNGILSQQLQEIFSLLGHEEIKSLKDANNFAQQHLLRRGERWDAQEENDLQTIMRCHKNEIIVLLKLLGLVDAIEPLSQSYTYALLMGALKRRVYKRMDYLAALYNDGYPFDYIVLLGGERPLQPIEKEGLPEDIKTEAQMMVYLKDNHALLKDKKVIIVNAPMIIKEDGSSARPITDDTLKYFSQIAPRKGSCLVISDNPYVMRQTLVTQRILQPHAFAVEGAGSAASVDDSDIVMMMDELARTIYEVSKGFNDAK